MFVNIELSYSVIVSVHLILPISEEPSSIQTVIICKIFVFFLFKFLILQFFCWNVNLYSRMCYFANFLYVFQVFLFFYYLWNVSAAYFLSKYFKITVQKWRIFCRTTNSSEAPSTCKPEICKCWHRLLIRRYLRNSLQYIYLQ